jgi:nicotinamidase-related amidase
MLIKHDDSLLLIVDLQKKLAPAIHESDLVTANSVRLLQAASQLHVPSFVSEHYVKGLGSSLEVIQHAAVNARFFGKLHFSCAAEPRINELLHSAERKQIVLTGTETHVCVLQSALGLQEAGFTVFLVADASSSRTQANREAGIERMRACGIHIVTTEMVLFEWLHRAGTDEFRALLPLIK